ncbi:MAG: glycosyltransferase family 39 protein [Candidatus Omnitrophota bacterium]
MNKKYAPLLLVFIIVFFIASNYTFTQNSDCLFDKDATYHAESGAYIFQSLANGKDFFNALTEDYHWPPLYHVIAALLRIVFGVNFVFMTSTLFLVILLYATYKIGELLKDKTAGLLSALIISFYPSIYISSRCYYLELAQAAMTALILYFLMRLDNFTGLKYSLAFGLLLAAGLLIKQNIIIFLIGPFFVALYYLSRHPLQNKIKARNLALSLFICFFLAFLIYYKIYLFEPLNITSRGLARFLTNNVDGTPCTDCYQPRVLLFHLIALKKFHIGIPGLVLFFIGLPYFLKKNEKHEYKIFLLYWFLVPFCILTATTAKFRQYSFSYLPVFAIVAAVGITYIRPKFIKQALVAAFLIFSFLPYACFTFDVLPKLKLALMPTNPDKCFYLYWGTTNSRASNPAYQAAEYLGKIIGPRPATIGVVFYPTDEQPPQYTSYLNALLRFRHGGYKVIDFIRLGKERQLAACDYFIFIHSLDRGDKWLDYETFVYDLAQANELGSIKNGWQDKYVLTQQDRPPGREGFLYIPRSKIEAIAGYFPNLRLVKRIGTETREFLIYKNERQR